MKDIVTERLIVRDVCPGDAEAIFAIWNAKENRETIGGHQDTYEEVVEICRDKTRDLTTGIIKVAVLKETDEIIGTCRFGNYGRDYWNFGYNIKSNMWGKGFATEVLKGIIEFGKKEFNVKHFKGGALKENIASQRVMQKCGMTFCGLDEDGDPDYELILGKELEKE